MSKYVSPVISPDALESLDAEHDGVAHVVGTDKAPFVYVIRRPTYHEVSTYQSILKRENALKANHELMKRISVFPTGIELESQMARWPASVGAALGSETFTEFSGGALQHGQK